MRARSARRSFARRTPRHLWLAVQGALVDVSARMESVARVEPHIENAIGELEKRLLEVQQSLARNRTQMEAVRAANAALSDVRSDSARKAHFLGRISLYLESMPDVPIRSAGCHVPNGS